DPSQFERLLQRIWDPEEFLSPYGIRSLSKYHELHPFQFGDRAVGYEPGEAAVKLKGGNSNWRGPLWFPTTYLLIHSLLRFGDALGKDFSAPQASGQSITPHALAEEIANRMISIFKQTDGKRPVFGPCPKFHQDPHW